MSDESHREVQSSIDNLANYIWRLEAVVEAARELCQVWKDKGHGGNAEIKAHIKIAKAVEELDEAQE